MPDRWPPEAPPALPPTENEVRLRRIPLGGRLIADFIANRRRLNQLSSSSEPIARGIALQLEARSPFEPWGESPRQQVMLRELAEAITLEKSLTVPPAIHPDDPMPLLLWGAFDDITPLILQTKLRLSPDLLQRAYREVWTVRKFLRECESPTT